MHDPEALLACALRAAPRRHRLPPLPTDAQAAAAVGPDAALAFALEVARTHLRDAAAPPAAVQELFTHSLARLLHAALRAGGDAAFQARVLRSGAPAVAAYLQLAGQQAADRRAVRAAVAAVAHPQKLQRRAQPGLGELHALASEGRWHRLAGTLERLLGPGGGLEPATHAVLAALAEDPALARLQRLAGLADDPDVRAYRGLLARHGPAAGSRAAAARGRAAARAGDAAEQATLQAFAEVAGLLDAVAGAPGAHRALRGLRPGAGYPGATAGAKDEWDAALVYDGRIVLLAEVKASPTAALADFPRLLRGLARLAQAQPGRDYEFESATGPVRLAGSALRSLRPQGRSLPPNVVYCTTAPPQPRPPWLGAPALGLLLAQPAALAFGRRLAGRGSPPAAELAPVWHALATPRLHAALHQYETAALVRDAMLHPQDLPAALRACR